MLKNLISLIILISIMGCTSRNNSVSEASNETIWLLKSVTFDHMTQRQKGIDSLEASIDDIKNLTSAIMAYKYPKPKNEDFYDKNWNLYMLRFNQNAAYLKPVGKAEIKLKFEISESKYKLSNDNIVLREINRTDTSLVLESSTGQDNMKRLFFEPLETRGSCHTSELKKVLSSFSWHTNFFRIEGNTENRVSDFDAEIMEYSDQTYTHIGLDSGVIIEEFSDIWQLDCYHGVTIIMHGRSGKVNSFYLIPEYIGEDQIDGRFIEEFGLLQIPGVKKENFSFIIQPITDA